MTDDVPTVVRECGCLAPRGVACDHGHKDGETVVIEPPEEGAA